MKAIKYIVFLVLILGIGFSIYIAVQPNNYRVSRSKTLNAPATVVYNNVIDFKNWEAWSSWVEADPNIKITLPEQSKGVGGYYTWQDKDGKGIIKTVAAEPNSSITQEMQFAEFPKSDISWDFKQNANGTTDVTWTIAGDNLGFGFKLFSTLMGGMEKQIGPHYERSLQKLDSVLVADMQKYSIIVNGEIQHGGGYYLYNTTSCKIPEVQNKMPKMLTTLNNFVAKQNISLAGSPFTYYHKWDEANNAVIFSSCMPTTEKIISTDPEILTGQLQPFRALKTTLTGNYKNLNEALDTAMAYIKDNNLSIDENGPMLEYYINDPKKNPNPADWMTELYVSIK